MNNILTDTRSVTLCGMLHSNHTGYTFAGGVFADAGMNTTFPINPNKRK